MTSWSAATLPEAIAGLRDRAAELADYPQRLHVAGVQPADLLGSPKLSPEFWRWLTGSIHATHEVREEVACPMRTDPECPRCGGQGFYVITRDVYSRPLARALWSAARRSSKLRPHPVVIVALLLEEGFDVTRTARRWGTEIASDDQRRTEEARVLSAIRAVRARYEETVLGPMPGWVSRSEAQRNAEDAA